MTTVAVLPVTGAAGAGKTAVKSDGKAAAGFGDALKSLLSGPATETGKPAQQQLPAQVEETPAEVVPNTDTQLDSFALDQAVPAQLMLPAATALAATARPEAGQGDAVLPGTPGATIPAAAGPATSAPAFAQAAVATVPGKSQPDPGAPAARAAQAPSAVPAQPAAAVGPSTAPLPVSKAQDPAMQASAGAQSAQPSPAVPLPAKAGTVAAAVATAAERPAPAPAPGETPPQTAQAAAGLAVPKPADPASKPGKAGAAVSSMAATASTDPAAAGLSGAVPAVVLGAAVPVQTAIIQTLLSQAVAAAPAQAGGAQDSPDTVPVPAFGTDTSQTFAQVAAPALTVPAAASAPAAAAAPAAPVPQGYTAQLAKPIFSIATAGVGEHTMTVSVNPENLGPVTVQAHIGSAGIRIELFAASADGRDVLRQALPDLKRDLAGAGISASLDLSSNAQSGSPQGGQDRESFARRFATSNQTPASDRLLEVKDQTVRTRTGLYGPETVLDVMA